MKSQRFAVHLISVSLLVLWGAVMIYFYASGRVIHYLPSDGLFRPLMLAGGIGMIILGLFNLLTFSQAESACCGHDHGDGHNHDHAHDDHHHHDHDHKDGCCGHDHSQDHSPAPVAASAPVAKKACCDHGHDHDHDHSHAHHDHDHSHNHGHDQSHAGDDHNHSHGVLEGSNWAGRLVAVLILAAPLTWAAVRSPDQYSANAIINKNLYNPTYGTGARAEQFSLKSNSANADKAKAVAAAEPVTSNSPPSAPAKTPPAGMATATPNPEVIAQKAAAAPTAAAETKSYGSFTLADLKKQVPQSKEGNFILEVPEIYYTAGDAEVQKVITGQPVETIAQVLPEKVNNASGNRLRIFRMLIQCCAADARPYSVPVEFGAKAPEFKDMTWVKVTGKMSYKKEGDQTVPIIEGAKMEETTAPENSMIY